MLLVLPILNDYDGLMVLCVPRVTNHRNLGDKAEVVWSVLRVLIRVPLQQGQFLIRRELP